MRTIIIWVSYYSNLYRWDSFKKSSCDIVYIFFNLIKVILHWTCNVKSKEYLNLRIRLSRIFFILINFNSWRNLIFGIFFSKVIKILFFNNLLFLNFLFAFCGLNFRLFSFFPLLKIIRECILESFYLLRIFS